ncbi:hypothetical protein [Blastopirellula marina]|uniref:Uncharacterized protein n=1 Tax=Blastopirellula marina DSM 3645 TaxID=314230 RepID=A3ZMW5_9BACT|nr:hypothetical protein [Blastopirellula marina]EAQ82294.1 hypothetical protein DSM3645_01230 [Blastopirellula marina DSM 3645]
MLKYLLTTDEGEQVVVNSTQAGELIQTPSGRTVEVPPLRELRSLPLYEADSRSRPLAGAGEWNRAAGLLFAVGFVVMLLGFGMGGYIMMRLPEAAIVEPFPEEQVASEFQKLPAEQLVQMWGEFSEQGYLEKIRDFRTRNEVINLIRSNRINFALACFGVGLVGMAIVAGAAVLGGKRKRG